MVMFVMVLLRGMLTRILSVIILLYCPFSFCILVVFEDMRLLRCPVLCIFFSYLVMCLQNHELRGL